MRASRLLGLVLPAAGLVLAGGEALAAPIYWDGTGTSWNTVDSWSLSPTADTPDPDAVPGAGDDAIFSISTVTANQIVSLNANQSVLSLQFRSSGTTAFQGGGGNRSLTIGAGGLIVHGGAGNVTIGSSSNGQNVAVSLGGNVLSNAGLLQFNNNVNMGGGTRVFTVNSGLVRFTGGGLQNGSLVKAGGGVLEFNPNFGGTNTTFTGPTIVNAGTLQIDVGAASTNNVLSASSALVMGGGTVILSTASSGNNSFGQTFNGTTFNAGASSFYINNTNSSVAPSRRSLNLRNITRNVGGTADFVQPSGTLQNNNGYLTTLANTNGILGGWATVNGRDWASSNGTHIVALATYTDDTWAPGNNTNVTTSGEVSDGTTNSLRFATAGATTLTLSGTNVITSGGILVTGDVGANPVTIQGADASSTLSGAPGQDLVVIQNNVSGALNLAVTIADNGSATGLTKSGLGTLNLLDTANTYTGATYLNGGVTNVAALADGGVNSSLGASSNAAENLVLNGGTLQYTGEAAQSTDRLFSLGANGGTIDSSGDGVVSFTNTGEMGFNGAGGRTLTLAGSNTGANTMAVLIGDHAADAASATHLVKSGAGTWVLTNANTYTGATSVNGGTLVLDFSAAGAPTGNIIADASSLVLGGGTLNVTGAAGAINAQSFNGTTIDPGTSAVTATQNGAAELTVNLGAITRNTGGAVAFTLPATGNITTTSGNDATGILGLWASVGSAYATVSGGNIVAYTGGAAAADAEGLVSDATNYDLAAGATLTASRTANSARYTGGEGVIDLGDAGANTLTLNGLMNAGSGTLTIQRTGGTGTVVVGASRELVINTASADVTINTPIVNNGAGASSVTVTGPGTVILGSANTFSGGLNVGGITQLNHATAAGTGVVTVVSNNALRFGPAVNATLAGLNGSGGITLADTGDNAVTLTLSPASGVTATYAGSFSGPGGITKTGPGTQRLEGLSSYTGVTAINGGVLIVGTFADGGAESSIGASSNAAANLIFTSGATLRYAGSVPASTDRLFSLGNGVVSTLDSSGTAPIAFTNTGNLGLIGSAGRTFQLAGTNSAENVFAPAITQAGTGGSQTTVNKTGIGTWVLAGNNQYTGSTNIQGGTLIVTSNSNLGSGNTGAIALGSSSSVGILRIGGDGTVFATSRLMSISSASGAGGVIDTGEANNIATFSGNLNNGTKTLHLIGSGFGSYGGVISNTGGLTKNGTGTWELTGDNTYSGVTTISAGVLLANNTSGSATGSNTVAVNNGGTLGGSGAVSGAVSVASGGTLSPGATPNSIGTLDTGSLSMVAGSTYRVDVDLTADPVNGIYASDRIAVTGTVTLGGTLELVLNGALSGPIDRTILLIDNDDADLDTIDTTFANITPVSSLSGPVTFEIYYSFNAATNATTGGNDVAIHFTSVPEPATVGLVGAVGLLLARRRRKR